MPTVACDFLSRERERESGVGGDEFLLLGVVDAHTVHLGVTSKATRETKNNDNDNKRQKGNVLWAWEKEQESEMGDRIKVRPNFYSYY